MTKGEQARGERQGEDVCVCRDDREKDRYEESVTVGGGEEEEEGDR